MSHFVGNKLFSSKQFGFIRGRSTCMQLLKVLDQWTEYLELGGQIDVIYTDLEKRSIRHRRLISNYIAMESTLM